MRIGAAGAATTTLPQDVELAFAVLGSLKNRFVDVAQWTLFERLTLCIQRKDSPASVKGGPYDDYYLVIYSDEWTVASRDIAEELRGVTFPTRLITHALLFLSYDPRTKRYPVFHLPVSKG